MIDPKVFEANDQWPQYRPVMRVNWFRVGLALALPALLVALSLGGGRIQIRVISGQAAAPTEVSSAPAAGASQTLELVAEPVSDSRPPLVPLGISVRGARELSSAAMVEIIGVPSGWVVSAGRQLGDRWRIPVPQLSGVVVLPSQDFSGAVDITAELRLADDTLVERRSLRLAVTTNAPERERPAEKGMSDDTLLLGRAEVLLSQRDVSSARVALRRLAQVGNARAALLLGETYEQCRPCTDGDRAEARTWYEKAARFGSAEARRRLDQLEQQDHDLPRADPFQHPSSNSHLEL